MTDLISFATSFIGFISVSVLRLCQISFTYHFTSQLSFHFSVFNDCCCLDHRFCSVASQLAFSGYFHHSVLFMADFISLTTSYHFIALPFFTSVYFMTAAAFITDFIQSVFSLQISFCLLCTSQISIQF